MWQLQAVEVHAFHSKHFDDVVFDSVLNSYRTIEYGTHYFIVKYRTILITEG